MDEKNDVKVFYKEMIKQFEKELEEILEDTGQNEEEARDCCSWRSHH